MTEQDEHLVARLEERIASMQQSITALRDALHEYVRLERYLRVEIAVFGLIGTVMGALIIYVFNKMLVH